MIKAEIVYACMIYGAPKKPGDSAEVDENTFNNLVRKGVLKAATAKAVKIVDAPALAAKNAAGTPLHHHRGRIVVNMLASEKTQLVAFLKTRRKRAECDEFLAKNKAAVFDILGKLPGGNFTQSNAMIYRADAISYEYPAAIVQLEQDLAGQKKIMQLDGRAGKIIKGCVKFQNLVK